MQTCRTRDLSTLTTFTISRITYLRACGNNKNCTHVMSANVRAYAKRRRWPLRPRICFEDQSKAYFRHIVNEDRVASRHAMHQTRQIRGCGARASYDRPLITVHIVSASVTAIARCLTAIQIGCICAVPPVVPACLIEKLITTGENSDGIELHK